MTDRTRIPNRDSKRNPDRGGSGAHRGPFDAFADSRAGRAQIAADTKKRKAYLAKMRAKRAAKAANPNPTRKRIERRPTQKLTGKLKKSKK